MQKNDKISKLLVKYQGKISYGINDGIHEFLFSRNYGFLGPDNIDESNQIRMTEEMAAPILAVIEDVIPYSYDYYYENKGDYMIVNPYMCELANIKRSVIEQNNQ